MDVSFLFVCLFVCLCEVHGQKNIRSFLATNVFLATINSTKNTVVSVLPLQFSLCKLASIANGEVKNELVKALGFKKDKQSNDELINTFYTNLSKVLVQPLMTDLQYVNKMYFDYSNDIDKTFLINSSHKYGVQIERVSYTYPKAAAAFINREISTATLRRVEDVIKYSDINKLTSIFLVTAAYFKPTWEVQFDYSLTKPRKFQLINLTNVEVPMMSKFDTFQYYDARDYRVLTIKLGNWGCSMTFVQPTFIKLEKVLIKLQANPDLLKRARRLMRWTDIRLELPRMKIRSHIDLTEHLKQIGVKETFNSNSTGLNRVLNPGVNSNNIFISKVMQKLFLELDEFGIVRVNRDWPHFREKPRAPPNTIEVSLDRPFYFTVNLEVLGMDQQGPGIYNELFNGVYYGPE